MADLNDTPPPGAPEGGPDPREPEKQRTAGKLAALGSGLGCLIIGTVPVSLFIIFGVAYYLMRGCS